MVSEGQLAAHDL